MITVLYTVVKRIIYSTSQNIYSRFCFQNNAAETSVMGDSRQVWMDAMFFHRTLDLVILKTGNPILLCFTYNSNDKYAGLSLYVDCVARLRIAESTTWLENYRTSHTSNKYTNMILVFSSGCDCPTTHISRVC